AHATLAILNNLIGGLDVEVYKQSRSMDWEAIKIEGYMIRDGWRAPKRLEASSTSYK
nr:hypothetical protein [Tanacetum cinerariifolium]